MCDLYSNAEPELFEQVTRSVRIDGVVTSIRLEKVFWQLLNQIAAAEELKLSTFISRIYNEREARNDDNSNFSSLLRVACVTYMNNEQRLKLTNTELV
ncbi:ribbon-helix-helix domain-containing protein [Psychrobium sp. 1_MG-2023]|uniref:ribbon-helix-helix domain-containing protein n=1 Tax=Psychrobium sp. 1_MG-2023 TaxID=3062624 RepID=UPI000C33E928|nr:ribbon-helix-helix domain-containing protein [Psychrobium sp. 1_MG-2023]MDP2559768.1 ribbon-helix-helix domain-containing protein [Psychrobium sp. 1_MG-2023]PKF59124.1 DNA-binding protein [Alteromonadales bacterium alter-6D02]